MVDEFIRSIDAITVEPNGALLVGLVTSDGESYFSALTPLDDIAMTTEAPSVELFTDAVRLTDLCRGSGALFFCDADGNVHTNASGAWEVEPVTPGKGLLVVRALPDGSIVTAGTAGTVHRRDAAGWTQLGESLGGHLYGLDGRSARELVVCGEAGLIATFDGAAWAKSAPPSNAILNTVLAAGDSYWIGGHGTLLRGTGTRWEHLGPIAYNIHELAAGPDAVWAACGASGAAQISPDGNVSIVRDTFAAFRVRTAERFVAFAGNVIVARFDGTEWKGRRYG